MTRPLNERGCQMLCAAIVSDAVQDYISALRHRDSTGCYESFFRSKWCRIYLAVMKTTLTGEDIITMCKKRVRDENIEEVKR